MGLPARVTVRSARYSSAVEARSRGKLERACPDLQDRGAGAAPQVTWHLGTDVKHFMPRLGAPIASIIALRARPCQLRHHPGQQRHPCGAARSPASLTPAGRCSAPHTVCSQAWRSRLMHLKPGAGQAALSAWAQRMRCMPDSRALLHAGRAGSASQGRLPCHASVLSGHFASRRSSSAWSVALPRR